MCLKEKISIYAVNTFIKSRMTIGLGTGSTAIWAIREIARKYTSGELVDIHCGVTGYGTLLEATHLGLPVYNLNSPILEYFDVSIDGADECDKEKNCTKGGGGCLLHEKIVAYASRQFVVLISNDKKVSSLGKTFPIPVEVVFPAFMQVKKKIQSIYKNSRIETRMDARKVGPWITEEGNGILDVYFDDDFSCEERERELNCIVGVVECGIFSVKRYLAPPTICVIEKDATITET